MHQVWKKLVESGHGVQETVVANLRPRDEDDEMFAYQLQDEVEVHCESRNPGNSSSRTSSFRPASLVTSTKFDSDEALVAVARAMLHRYEHEQMSEQEAINATLKSPEDIRAFLEALDTRYAMDTAPFDDQDDPMRADTTETFMQVRMLFLPTLKTMWQAASSSSGRIGMMTSNIFTEEPVMGSVDDEYRQPPRAPKNLHLSPITRPSYVTDNDSPAKRRRTWFFSDSGVGQRLGKAYGNGIANPFASTNLTNPFGSGKVIPEFRFEFGGKESVIKVLEVPKKACSNLRQSLEFGKNPFASTTTTPPVQALQLDGLGEQTSASSYMPPTSPIRR
ncbi:MAG: hypothetical protein SGILL_002782, partial [Bacillariaceae sp.]